MKTKKKDYKWKYFLLINILLCLPFIFAYHTYPELENNMLHKNKQIELKEHHEVERVTPVKIADLKFLQKDDIDRKFDIITRKVEGKQRIIEVVGITDAKTIIKTDETEKQRKIDLLIKQINLLEEESNYENIKAVQEILKSFGYYKGKIDGIYGPLTEQALQTAENIHNIEFIEEVTPTAIASIDTKKEEQESDIDVEPIETIEEQMIEEKTKNNSVDIIETAKSYMGTPYVWGGSTPAGFDCSGFIQFVYNNHGHALPRTVNEIWNYSSHVESPAIGDLVFFETYTAGPSHLGIYIGDGDFIHAGVNNGVTISNLNNSYWGERYLGSKRIPS